MNDTIVAIATAPGRGAIGVVRVSGPQARHVMRTVCGRELAPRMATHLSFLDADHQPMDDGLAIFFPGPNSYTGEDVLELQGHGGLGVLQMVLQRCLGLSGERFIRLAHPGEFTQRAFLNNKLDLAQAEAVADLIDAGSERAARSAVASLQGLFSQKIQALLAGLIDLRMRVEACLDFPEEDIELIAREGVSDRLAKLLNDLAEVRASAQRGAALREGLRVVLVGAPNVGKSSLLNALAEDDVALVTEIAGTTRDRIVQEIMVEGLSVQVIDTAGLRNTEDPVEQLGIERTWREIEQAQLVVLLNDASGQIPTDHELEQQVLRRAVSKRSVVQLLNKIDLNVCVDIPNALKVSTKTGEGLDELRAKLLDVAGLGGDASAGTFSARARHLHALDQVGHELQEASSHLRESELDLLAECLRQAQQKLAEITGEFSSDDLLGEIFGRFCIGK